MKPLLDISNFPKARELIDSMLSGKYRVIDYGGAVRGGKTYNTIAGLILLHRLFPKSRSCIVRNTLSVLRTNTYPTAKDVIPKNFVKSFRGDPYFHWTFTNDSEMFFFQENYANDKNFDRWNGLEVNFIMLEQCEELQFGCFEKALERVGSYVIPNGEQPPPLIAITVNPSETWEKREIYDKWKNGTLPDNYLYIQSLITDNPHIPKSYIDSLNELKRINPVKYKRFVEGDREIQDVIEMAYFSSFDYFKHVINDKQINNENAIHLSFDKNVNPYLTCSIWQVENNKFIQIKEFCLPHPKNRTRIIAQEIAVYLKQIDYYQKVYVYGDSTALNDDTNSEIGSNFFTIIADVLRKNGYLSYFRVPGKRNGNQNRRRKNPNSSNAADFINSILDQKIKDYSIEILKSCKTSINDYINVKQDKNGNIDKSEKDIKTGGERYGHISDTMKYFICEYLYDDFMYFSKNQQRYL